MASYLLLHPRAREEWPYVIRLDEEAIAKRQRKADGKTRSGKAAWIIGDVVDARGHVIERGHVVKRTSVSVEPIFPDDDGGFAIPPLAAPPPDRPMRRFGDDDVDYFPEPEGKGDDDF